MVRAKILFLFAVLFWTQCDLRGAEKLESIPLGGERYVSMQKWARAKGFTIQWNKAEKDVLVTSAWARLAFKVNSRRAEINGIVVWLSAGITSSGDTLYLGERDIFTLIHPILYPEKDPGKVRTVVVAAGHGGKDPGFVSGAHQEKKYALLMAKVVAETLRSAGFKVIMTRESDIFVDTSDQAAIANRAKADLFITIHYNAFSRVEAKGIETFCLTPVGALPTNGGSRSRRSPGNKQDSLNALLAYQVHKSMIQNSESVDRGVKRAGFIVLRDVRMPGILIEGGFLSNPYDAARIKHPLHRRKMARAITDGVLAYKRLVERN